MSRLYCSKCKTICAREIKETSQKLEAEEKHAPLDFSLYTEYFEAKFT
jgi:hypothetical protein